MKALDLMMVDSGFEEVVLEAGICASGSLKKVMSGKHYKRAMRVHQLINDAIQRLMLQAFIDKNPDLELLDLQQLALHPSHSSVTDVNEMDAFRNY